MKKNKAIYASIISLIMAVSLVLGVVTNPAFKVQAASSDSYVELYSPDKVNEGILYQNPKYLSGEVVDHNDTESGKALALDYKAGHSGSINVAIPTAVKPNENFKGIALWVDIPETIDEYSFTMFLVKDEAIWQVIEMGTPLTLISHDGKVTEVSSIWKRFQLSGFKGWVMIPKEAFPDPAPEAGKQYKFVIMFEDAPTEGAKRTSDMKFYLGSIGYYTDYTGFMFEKAGEDAMSQAAIKQISGYVDEIKALKPKTEREVLLKNKMLVHFSNLKENFNSLSSKEKVETVKGLYDEFYDYMEDYLYGDIRKTELLMTFATMSDTHFSNTWVNERFLSALTDAKTLDPDLSAVFVLGDISNEGVSPSNPALTELDNYYDWLDSYQYKNSKGEDIPIRNVLGNHDYRGPSTEPGGSYPKGAYAPAVEMYLEREGVETLQWDMWLNGYHFIFLNSDKYHTDDAYLSAQTIDWLDAALAENDNGQPAFVLIHQPLDRVHVMEGAKYTFAEVIARHSNAIVLSGHNHSDFGNARIIDEGNGYFVNQPAMVNLSAQYYFVEVYEGGVIFRAREAATKSWHISSDVVVANFDRSNNVVASADSLSISTITLDGVTAVKEKASSVSGQIVKLTAGANGGSAVIPAYAAGNISNYAGFAIYAEGQNALGVKVGGQGLKANATYYAVENGAMVKKSASANGQIVANGWIMIPKASFDGELVLSKDTTLEAILSANQEVSIDKISYYFVAEDFINEVTNPACSFFDADGSLISISSLAYGSEVVLPKNPTKQSTAAYDYEFAGWDLDGDGKVDELPSLLKGSFKAVAVYDATIRQYTYTFYNADGTEVLKTATADYGTVIIAPVVDSVYGWDLDGDGAVESIPTELVSSFTATAVIGIPPYENATVIFDPEKLDKIPLSTYSYGSAVNLCTVNSLPVNNANAPSGKVAQFTYKYTDGNKTQNGSDYVQLEIPYTGDVSNFQGYAIWVDIPATEEAFIGGLKINSVNLTDPVKNGWVMISSTGEITYADTKWEGQGTFPLLGKGFTGWVIVDKIIYSAGIEPKANGYIYFQIKETGRTTPYVMNIGQILMYSNKEAIINELSSTSVNEAIEYSFNDGNGHIYKAGQVSPDESIIVPLDPISSEANTFFAGWDLDGDGYPDELPEDGKISKKFNAVAVFYNINAFTTVNDGSIKGWAQQETSIKVESVDYSDSPTGKAIKVTKSLHETITAYAKFTLPVTKQPNGIALWMDASDLNGFGMQLFKNWKPKQTVKEGGDYVYFYGEDGSLAMIEGWRALKVPANFKGWLIFPMSIFTDQSEIVTGDYLRFGIDSNEDGNNNFSGIFYFGEVVYFDCSVDMFMKQIDKRVYGFKDYDGSFISCGIAQDGDQLVVPADPVREGWTFVGWDIDGDGLADEVPATYNRTFGATAVYTRQLTYKFVTEDGEVILEKTDEYNALILPPFRYLENDPIYQYKVTYLGYEDGMLLTENFEFVVKAEVVSVKEYSYSFVVDGQVVHSGSLEHGAVITLPEDPTKAAEEHATFVFAGWDGYTEGMTITEDVVFTAIFNKVLNKYTVTFYGADGITVISSEELEYGATITLPEEPVLEGHNFVGWSGYSNGMKVEGNLNFRAMFELIEDNTDSSSDSNSSSAPKVTVNCTSSLGGSLFALLVVSCAAMLIKRKK